METIQVVKVDSKHLHEVASGQSTGIKPFLKWAGGKTQILPTIRRFIPTIFKRYFEPFVGGGALYFDLGPTQAYLSDTNPELINCYNVVKESPEQLLSLLSTYAVSEEEFYRIRKIDPETLPNVERAARLIYLNKTCYNGLYRVNKQGHFNTPFGGHKNPRLVDPDNLRKASKLLKEAAVFCADYYEVLTKEAEAGDFIYLDPPYLPVGAYSDFKRYTRAFFYKEDHRKLAALFELLDQRGCLLLLSNSYHPDIIELYGKYDRQVVRASRFINCKGSQRGAVNELIISNFPLSQGLELHGLP